MFAAFNARLLSPFHAPEHWGHKSYELSEPVFTKAELDQAAPNSLWNKDEMESMEGLILNLWSLSTGSRIENI